MFDIVFPDKNEKEFLEIARKLGNKELYFVYPYKKKVDDYKKILYSLQKQTKIKLNLGLIAKPNDISKAKNICKFVITESSDKDQHILEKTKPNLIFSLEKQEKRDKYHYRISGFNQVLAKIAFKNKTIIGFSFSELLNTDKSKRIILLGRIIQNIKICKKYKVKTLLVSFATKPYEQRSLKTLQSLKEILRKLN